MLFALAVICISFVVGFAMKRGGLCTYAAVLQIVQHKRFDLMMIFLGASAWATLTVLPLYWSMPDEITLSLTHHHLLIAVVGGAVLGIGAFINKGCFFGTFVQLVSGNLNYISTLFGLATGTIITHLYLNNYIPSSLISTDIVKINTVALAWLIGMIAFALFMTFSSKISKKSAIKKFMGLQSLSWQGRFYMIVIGIGGGLLYGTVSGWNYADVLANTTTKFINKNDTGASTIALISTIAMVIGGISAAITAKDFSIKPVRLMITLSCFMGGILMGIASLLTPGGNDGLLLKGIPSFALHAIIGYLMMILIMLLMIYLFRRVPAP